MKSHLSEDTDEENCDDPIKLFDNDINAVYFGSQPHKRSTRDTESRWTLETIGNYEFCQPSEISTFGRPDDNLVQTIQSGTTSECDISPLCVKLVDCRKFPWYYRKYTQQIMQKLNLHEHSDSDLDIDVEGIVDDSDDCFILEDLHDVVTNKIITNDQICINTLKSTEPKPKLPKKKRHKDDREIQRALSLKNLVKVDLKRNQGLVGMKITQKIETNITLDFKTDKDNVIEEADAKQTCVMADEKYLSAANKTLCHIGTQLIPITEEKEINSISQLNINNKEKDLVGKPALVKSSSCQNVPVQFDICKISEKLIDNLMSKKINDQSSEAKPISKLPNKTLINNPENTLKTINEKELNIVNEKELCSKDSTEKLTNSSSTLTSHVKDVKKTNKYKNDQIKIKNMVNHSSLIGLLVTDKSKEDVKETKCTKQKRHRDDTQNKATKLDKKSHSKIEKQKREPKSPILHCSTVPKKPKQLQMPPKCNKTDTNSNSTKVPGKLKQIVDKLTHLNSCNLMQDTNRPKHVIPKIAPVTTYSFDVHSKQASQKESCMMQDKTVSQVRNIHAKSLNASDKLLKNCNEISKVDFKTNNLYNNNTQLMSLSQNKTLNEQNVHEPYQHKVNKHTINAASVTNPTPKAPIINNKPTLSNSNVSTTAVVPPASGSNAVLSKQNASFPTPHVPHIPIHNAVPSKTSSNNIPNNNINVPVQNRYASAIILKSNNHTNFPFEKYCEQTPVRNMAFQSPMTVLSHTQPRSRDPQPPYPIFYPPAPLGHHSYFPSSTSTVANQFHPPQSHIGQQSSNPMQDFYRECWLPQNLAPPPPPPPPVPPFNFPPRNGHVVNQSKDCSNLNSTSTSVMLNPQSASHQNSVNTQQTKNSSIIGMNNDGLVKKINIVAMPVKNINIKKGTVKVEQIKTPQIMSPVEHSEVVATKTEMLKELDKLSFVDENINELKRVYPASVNNENKNENTLEVAIMSKNPGRFETLKLTMNQKDNPIQTKPAQGYSPPILPIPTYQKVLDRATSKLETQNATPKIALRPGDPRSNLKNECKPMRKRDFVKNFKRKLNACNNDEDSRKKDDAKKISLEEYKKRILKNDCKSEYYKKTCKEKYDISGKRPNIEFKYRKKVDYSTETDLGYDSDSTVVL